MSITDPTSIAEQLFFTTVRIDTIEKNTNKSWSGTGFIIHHALKDKQTAPFVVTNRHVVENMEKGILTFLKRKNGKPVIPSRQSITYDNFENHWVFHSNPEIDVAVMPLASVLNQVSGTDQDIFYKGIPSEVIPSEEQLKELDAIEDIVFVGYPNSLRDEYNLTPIVRTGVTATPVTLNYNNKPIFLIDAPVYEGSSGSPVLIMNRGMYPKKDGGTQVGNRVLLLGIVAEYLYFEQKSVVEKEKVRKGQNKKVVSKTSTNLDIGVVFNVTAITETINHFFDLHPVK